MYTYGYVVDATLAKLDMTAEQAEQMGLLSKFPYFANEAMSQICSAVKPKRDFAKFNVAYKEMILNYLKKTYPNETFSFLDFKPNECEELSDWQKQCYDEYHSLTFINEPAKMPKDFISFGDEINRKIITKDCNHECDEDNVVADDEDFEIRGSNKIMFFKPGTYYISYNAKWFYFDRNTDYDEEIEAPDDVIECLPSYIASQCFKIDDEIKSQVYRNEYEMFLSRIDDDHYISNKGIRITGGW